MRTATPQRRNARRGLSLAAVLAWSCLAVQAAAAANECITKTFHMAHKYSGTKTVIFCGELGSRPTPALAQRQASAETTCHAHDDHWHCPEGVPEPTTPPPREASATASSAPHEETTATGTVSCHAHGDHWHCPSGVPEPTTPPPATTASASSSRNGTTTAAPAKTTMATCTAHDKHWHCPSGVAQPTTPPAHVASSTTSVPSTTASGAPASANSADGGASGAVSGLGLVSLLAWILAIAL